MNIGIVGTGLMGSQIALRLAHKGYKVTVFNRDKSKAEKLRSANGSLFESKATLGCAKRITLKLFDSYLPYLLYLLCSL